MKLILIRHGEAFEGNLTIKGVQQVVKTREKLLETKISAIYCSTADRCKQTMEEILRDRNDSMPIHMTSLLAPKMKSESYEKLKSRIVLFLDDLKNDHKSDENVVIVSHQKIIGMIIFQITGKVEDIGNGEIVEMKLL